MVDHRADGDGHAHDDVDDTEEQSRRRDARMVLDVPARAAATARAESLVTRFCHPTLTAERWLEGLRPGLTTTAADELAYVDPANVACSRRTGPARVAVGSRATVARVSVPTGAGPYLVILVRSSADPVWRAERISPPAVDPRDAVEH